MYFVCYTILLTCTEKLRLSSRSCQSVLCTLLNSCDFPAGAAKMYFACYTWKVATFEPELAERTSYTTLVRKSRDLRGRAAKALQTDAEEKTIMADTRA